MPPSYTYFTHPTKKKLTNPISNFSHQVSNRVLAPSLQNHRGAKLPILIIIRISQLTVSDSLRNCRHFSRMFIQHRWIMCSNNYGQYSCFVPSHTKSSNAERDWAHRGMRAVAPGPLTAFIPIRVLRYCHCYK